MEIKIKLCNSIDEGTIKIVEGKLNIKYGINGTGKSTIARAISLAAAEAAGDVGAVKVLKPFKFMDREDINPEVKGADGIKKVKVFDEEYISEFVFRPDELLKGSFEIFVKDDGYEKGMKAIDSLVEEIRSKLSTDKEIEQLISDFDEISGSFGKPAKKGVHGSSAVAKALKGGNKVEHVPAGLEDFKEFIQNSSNFSWVKWQIDGVKFIDISDKCPYCVSGIQEKKEKIKKVGEAYDHKAIENLNRIVSTFKRLSRYFSDDTQAQIEKFVKNIDGYTPDQEDYLLEVKGQIDRLNMNFKSLRDLSFFALKDVDKVIEALKERFIDVGLFNHLRSDETVKKVEIANAALDGLLKKAGDLQGSIAKQKRHIEKLVKENSERINEFLKNAGYKYFVSLNEDEKGEHKLKLIHIDQDGEVDNAKTHLSYGERNAFALVLFMFDAVRSAPDLIILDDPISSFDKNKKYAIVEMLFRKEDALKGKTVLMLTHDFEPIVDIVYHHSDRFDRPYAAFLENINGALSEREIQKGDIKTFLEINEQNIADSANEISKLIYMRRLHEVSNNKGGEYQLISSLLHKRNVPFWQGAVVRDLSAGEVAAVVQEISKRIPGFSYAAALSVLQDDESMKEIYYAAENNYEKLHIYRIIFDGKDGGDGVGSDVIRKFINEAFHIENDYIYQLNPREFQLVPQYVIDACDRHIGSLA